VDRFRDPVVARSARDTYRTFLLRELPKGARHPETRRATVPIRALFGVHDTAIHVSLVSPGHANADDYTLETVDATHFIIDECPDLVRARLVALADETKR
jgi:pimeloyl-ACP methyl ester carboxylesterase